MPDFSFFNQPLPASYGGSAPVAQGYQPSPYDQSQGYGPPDSYNPGYQPMPSPYQSAPGYQPPPAQPGQYYPHPAYDVGYQPDPYGQPPGAYQNPPYGSSPYQQSPQQLGFGAPQGQYPVAPGYNQSQGYGQPYGWPGGNPNQYNQPPSGQTYPYGQGEAMEHAQHTSMLSAEPVSTGLFLWQLNRSCDCQLNVCCCDNSSFNTCVSRHLTVALSI